MAREKLRNKIKTAQTLRSRNTVTRLSQLHYHRPRVPEQHTIALLLLVLRGKSPHKLERGKKKYARKRKYKNCAAPFFCFHFVLQLRRQQKKACTRENPSKPSKRGEKILNYRTPKKKRSVQHCPREESRRYKTAWTQATAFERQQKSTKRSAKRTGGLFVGGVCAP